MADENQNLNPVAPVQNPAPADPVPNLAPPDPAPVDPPPAIPPTPSAPNQTVDPIASMAPSPSGAQGNTSGQGSGAIVPEEIKGWSWGGFWLTWIWGVGNSVWLALLAFVPFVGWVMPFVLGIKGRGWAWQAKHWDSVEQFKKTQKTWGMVGLILGIIGLVLGVLWFVIVFSAMSHGVSGGTTTTY